MNKCNIFLLLVMVLCACKNEKQVNLPEEDMLASVEEDTVVEEKKAKESEAGEFYVVTAKSGLIIRSKPSLQGKVLGKLLYMSQVALLEKTDATLEIKDGGKTIKGHWVKIENGGPGSWDYGYIFNGFLQEKAVYINDNKEILLPSTYYSDDSANTVDKLSPYWVELYKEQDSFYIDNTKFTTQTGFNECTGDSLISIITERKSFLFINDLSLANTFKKINYVKVPNKMLWQKDEFSFKFNDKDYTIKVSGDYTLNDRDNGYQGEKKYVLTLFSENKSQIIFTQNEFNDSECKIKFIGDIDQDGKPDFIIDAPTHYEEERTVLLMSSDAEEEDFTKKRAEMSINFGC